MQKLIAYLPKNLSKKGQSLISGAAIIGFSVVYLLGFNSLGWVINTLITIPLVVLGWFYGQRGGLIAGVLSMPYLAVLYYLVGNPDWTTFLKNAALGYPLTVSIGVLSGWVSEILKTYHEQQILLEIQLLRQKQEQEKKDLIDTRYRTIVEQAGDVVYLTDLKGNFEYINPQGELLTGYSQPELAQMNYLDLVDITWRDKVQSYYKNQARQGLSETSLEFPIYTKDKIRLWVEQTTNLLMDAGRLTGFQSIMRDITRRKLVQEELAVARDQAELANKLKSRLLAILSHDIRTPLNAILWYAEMIITGKHGPINDDQSDTLQKIINSSHQVNSLIHNLLNSAELESGQITLNIDSFQPTRVATILTELLSGAAESKGLTLTCSISPELPTVIYGDFQRIQQVLINLVSNAIKFTNQGGVTIQMLPISKTEWKIEVNDTGPGIPEHAQSDIFKPFHQLKENQPTDQKGIGLGLSIVKEYVELMGGEVGLVSQVGQGSRFWVVLPTKPSQDK